mgnify:CR=1 FL=1
MCVVIPHAISSFRSTRFVAHANRIHLKMSLKRTHQHLVHKKMKIQRSLELEVNYMKSICNLKKQKEDENHQAYCNALWEEIEDLSWKLNDIETELVEF